MGLIWFAADAGTLVSLVLFARADPTFPAVWSFAMAGQMGWFVLVAQAATRLKAVEGNLPWSERKKLLPWALAMVAFAWIGLGTPPERAAQVVGLAGVAMSIAAKLWISRSRIKPGAELG